MPCDASSLLPICFWLALVGEQLSGLAASPEPSVHHCHYHRAHQDTSGSVWAAVTLQGAGVSLAAACGPAGFLPLPASSEAGSPGSQVSMRPEQNMLCLDSPPPMGQASGTLSPLASEGA